MAPSFDEEEPLTEQPPCTTGPTILKEFKFDKSTKRLNQIDEIRSKGVGAHISLPQLVVCGDQSAGKSSVLEGITGIPFPKKDGLCTRFATEIIIRHSPGNTSITASLDAHKSRSDSEKADFAKFRRKLQSFDELESVINDAAFTFGVRGYGADPNAPAFAHDVLRLEVVGDTGLHLTVVDLPGLISVADNQEDVSLVRSLVDSYLENERTIILAVVQATSDIDTQGIIQQARNFDPLQQRTLGIVTKPDLINEGTESRIALLSHNRGSTSLKLGFFLIKNPSPSQSKKARSIAKRERLEEDFFSDAPWRTQDLNRDRVGMKNLRKYCQELLAKHINQELPKVIKEITDKRKGAYNELLQLGPERASIADIRAYVSEICQTFSKLTRDATEGLYDGSSEGFFRLVSEGDGLLLRARVHALNEKFKTAMTERGDRRYVVEQEKEGEMDEGKKPEMENEEFDTYYPGRERVTEQQFSAWIKETIARTRGRELPGKTNPYLLWSLFREQSQRWDSIAEQHLQSIISLVSDFAGKALVAAVKDDAVRAQLQVSMNDQLDNAANAADEELSKLLQDEKSHPITYNSEYTATLQAKRDIAAQEASRYALSDLLDQMSLQDKVVDRSRLEELTSMFKSSVVVDPVANTCIEAARELKSYYQVAIDTFIDNVCKQVVERHILRGLTKVLSPSAVSKFSDEYLVEIAGESPAVQEKRKELRQLVKALGEGLQALRV